MERHSLDIAGDKMDNSTASYFLRMATAVVISIGAVISILAFFILMLSIFLLLQKNREKLHQLMLLGYSPAQVARPYVLLIASVNMSVLILACAVTAAVSSLWSETLHAVGATPASIAPTLAAGAMIMGVVSALNIQSVRRRVRKDF